MKKTIARVALIFLVLVLCMSLTACRQKVGTAYADKEVGFQTELPAEGETVAIMHTSQGDIYLRLFPEAAPKAVENFLTHASQKYYDGLTFHRVIDQFMIQGGDPTGTGCGGESIYGEKFEDEFDPDLHNINGALSMANAGPNTNGSQFFIVQASEIPDGMIDQMRGLINRGFPENTIKAYEALGGTPWLDFRHSVFGQVFEGMDVVNAIANVKTNGADRPLEDVKIVSIDINE